ncbi:MAG: DNA topoisomerase VI subunit B [Haloferacaceae archaeon]
MTSFQSQLGEGGGVAEELAESQRAISIAEFFEKNKHMLGFDSGARALVTAVKEGVDNALDAAEEAGIPPDVYVEISEVGDYYRLVIEDNGPGITREQLPKVFGKLLYGSRFHKREQHRGQQGIGISAAVLYAQLSSGKPVRVTSRTQGSATAQQFELVIDTDENEPEIREERETAWDRPHGTRIELEMEANMRARAQLHDYVEQTAVVNPHARVELREPGLDEPLKFERATDRLPAETEEIRPHPHGVELGTLLKMLDATDSYSLSGFLQGEFTRVGGKTADEVLSAFRDRHFGRAMAWTPPAAHEDADLARAVQRAVANKTAEATAAFADRVAAAVRDRDRVARHDVAAIVDAVAGGVDEVDGDVDVPGPDGGVEAEFDETFGATVRENAVAAAWATVTSHDDPDRLTPDCYRIVDGATSSRKDDETVRGLAERIADKFADGTDDESGAHRVTRDRLRAYVDRSADRTAEATGESVGDTARENVVEAFWAAMRTVPDDPPRVRDAAEDRNVAAELLEAMRETEVLAPPTECLSPIEADLIEEGLRTVFDADFHAAATRDAEVHGGDPFVVEAGVAYGGDLDDGTIDLLRFANRVPLVYQRGACATTDVVKRIDWRNYELDQPGGSGMPKGPAVVLVHVASTNVPFTSESKDAVANVPGIEDEIELAVREAARDLKAHLKRRQSLQKRRQKREVLGEILPEMADKLAAVTGRERPDVESALARIMNNVGVDRRVEDGTVTLTVRNHSERSADPDVTDIVDAEPREVSDGAAVVEMDGEWFVNWSPSIGAGETASLTYRVDDADPDFAIDVDGVEPERLTVSDR